MSLIGRLKGIPRLEHVLVRGKNLEDKEFVLENTRGDDSSG